MPPCAPAPAGQAPASPPPLPAFLRSARLPPHPTSRLAGTADTTYLSLPHRSCSTSARSGVPAPATSSASDALVGGARRREAGRQSGRGGGARRGRGHVPSVAGPGAQAGAAAEGGLPADWRGAEPPRAGRGRVPAGTTPHVEPNVELELNREIKT
ncbi:hypothetical protein VULLAG_LOCUS8236 [Vulpes lagopus]